MLSCHRLKTDYAVVPTKLWQLAAAMLETVSAIHWHVEFKIMTVENFLEELLQAYFRQASYFECPTTPTPRPRRRTTWIACQNTAFNIFRKGIVLNWADLLHDLKPTISKCSKVAITSGMWSKSLLENQTLSLGKTSPKVLLVNRIVPGMKIQNLSFLKDAQKIC